jgi:hypothetical protein
MLSLVSALVTLALGAMALTLTDVNTVRRKTRFEAKAAGVEETIRALFMHINTLGNPNLQFVTFSGLQSADAVIANVACLIYCIYALKPAGSTVDAWLKGSDNASTAGASADVSMKLMGQGAASQSLGNRQYAVTWADGLPFGTGLTLGSHTTNNGNSKSLVADAPTGFAIIGAGL